MSVKRRRIIVPVREYCRRLSMVPSQEEPHYVLDTSILVAYPAHLDGIFGGADVYIPGSVLGEIGPCDFQAMLRTMSTPLAPFESDGFAYRRMSRSAIRSSEKARTYRRLGPVLRRYMGKPHYPPVLLVGELEGMCEDADQPGKERRIIEHLLQQSCIEGAKEFTATVEEQLRNMSEVYVVSKADRDVLAAALFLADHGETAVVCGADSHLGDGVRTIRDDERYRTRVFCVEPFVHD